LFTISGDKTNICCAREVSLDHTQLHISITHVLRKLVNFAFICLGKKCTTFEVEGTNSIKRIGGPRKTWKELVDKDTLSK